MAVTLSGSSGVTFPDLTSLSSAAIVPSGSVMLFCQASAPTGWTQVTSDSADNRMLRVVKTAGAGTGGSASPILNNVVPSHTHGFTTGTVSADHTHGFSTGTSWQGDHSHSLQGVQVMYQASGTGPFFTGDNWLQYGLITSTSGAGGHSHSLSGTTGGISANHTHSGSTDNGSSQTNWAPRYIDTLMCTKN